MVPFDPKRLVGFVTPLEVVKSAAQKGAAMCYAHMLYRRAHDPRRTFVVRLSQSRSPPHPITKWMAHGDYRVTQRCDRSETI